MDSKPSGRVALIAAFAFAAICALWIPIIHLIFKLPLRNVVLLYLVASPLLFIPALGGFLRAYSPSARKSRSQKVLFFGGFPILGIVVWFGIVGDYPILAGAIWYVGLVTLSAYFFLWPRARPGGARGPE